MNELIEKLAEQAGYNGHYATEEFDVDEFARLVVRECARVVDSDDSSYPYDSFGHKLKEHFGVEE